MGRLVLAVLMMYFSVSDPEGFGYVHEPDDASALVYLTFTILAAFVAIRSWWWDFRLRHVVLAADLAMIVVVEHTEPSQYGFFTLAISIGILAMLGSALRFGEAATVRTAVTLNVVNFMACAVHNIPAVNQALRRTGEIDLSMDIRHVLLHAVTGALAVWLSRQINPIPRLPRFESGQGAASSEAALAYAMEITGARSGLLCWRSFNRSECQIVGYDAEAGVFKPPFSSCNAPGEAGHRTRLFDAGGRHVLELDEAGEIVQGGPVSDAKGMIALSGFSSGLSLPVTCGSGVAWLVLGELPSIGTDALRASPAITAEIAHGIDRAEFDSVAREAAMNGLRTALARDLHDSVAQSLAGAGYWLQSLQMRKNVPDEVRADIARTKQALDKENASIRAMIDRLRTELDPHHPHSLADDMRALADLLAQQWRLKVDLYAPDKPLLVGAGTAHDLQQILREGIANAVKHGNARSVDVAIRTKGDRVAIAIEDDGSGFAEVPVEVLPRSIAERTAALGGALEVCNGPRGARVTVQLPGDLFR
jgi:signal transduction histidine kinase